MKNEEKIWITFESEDNLCFNKLIKREYSTTLKRNLHAVKVMCQVLINTFPPVRLVEFQTLNSCALEMHH